MQRIFNSLIALLLISVSFFTQAGYQLPDYEKVTLENGLTVYLMEQKEVPLIDVNIVVRAGAIEDGNNAGISYLTAKNMILGSQQLSKKALDQAVDFVGAEIYSSANLEFATIGASFAAKDKAQLLPILRDLIITPRFDAEEFDKFKQRHLLNLQQNKERPSAVINNYFNRLLFGKQGYGAVVQGDNKSVDAMQLTDIKAHYQKWYQPKNSAVIVVGDFNSQLMKTQLNTLFGGWKNTAEVQPSNIAMATSPKKPQLLLVNKPDARQSTFLIGGKGIAKSNPDRVGLSVINTILGARFTSWLNDELRVNAGLTYGARSRFNAYSQDGSFVISTFTKTATTVEAIDLALKTYQRLWQQGLDQQTLASAKAYVKGQFPPNFETSSQLARLLADMYGYQFDENYINSFEQAVDSLTLEQTKQLISQYFPQQNLQFVVIGQADELREKLEKYGQLSEVQIADNGFNSK
ncbi:peptidase M16 [Thalassotalea insulae]|uniref:Peptidase M16 n=1 Tax=Thalassotalea insulae TaxID=2056778 RepID=A0ABQ6GVE5_9GAMM|nr:pitrilysin family protein [Thalassotalea insulae]GLX78617.1 peptidase M16 [Thalassotalea insulae]